MSAQPARSSTWPLQRDRGPGSRFRWSSAESLASAEPGRRYRVRRVLLAPVRGRCEELGCGKGQELICIENRRGEVRFSTRKKRDARMGREFAWFVEVEPL